MSAQTSGGGVAAAPAHLRSELEQLLEREPTVDTAVAFEFLGIGRDLGFRLLAAYRKRIAKALAKGRAIDSDTVRPRFDAVAGEWAEIPNHKVGGRLRVRSDLLLWMVYPERSREG